jgi:hypothetical protein
MGGETIMPGKIFYRERGKVGEGEKKPRFKLMAVSGVELDFYSYHLRKKELEQIAKAVGAKLVLMERSTKGSEVEVEVVDLPKGRKPRR